LYGLSARTTSHQHVRAAREQHHRRKGLLRIERELGDQAGIHRVGEGGHHQRVAVGSALGHEVAADDRAGARLVVHDHGLAQRLSHRDAERTGDRIRAAARRERNHQLHGLVGKGGERGRSGESGHRNQRGEACKNGAEAHRFVSWIGQGGTRCTGPQA
jgi:hypothetical protein